MQTTTTACGPDSITAEDITRRINDLFESCNAAQSHLERVGSARTEAWFDDTSGAEVESLRTPEIDSAFASFRQSHAAVFAKANSLFGKMPGGLKCGQWSTDRWHSIDRAFGQVTPCHGLDVCFGGTLILQLRWRFATEDLISICPYEHAIPGIVRLK